MDRRQDKRTFLFHIVLPVITAVLATSAIVTALLIWSAGEVDQISLERQKAILSHVIDQSTINIAYEQEAATVWDDAITHLNQPRLDMGWLDFNLGIWFHSYYGHDEVYILNPQDQPIYAMASGTRIDPARFDRVKARILPLTGEMRKMLLEGAAPNLADKMKSKGVTDMAIVNGHPAVVSIKPVVSDTGLIRQTPDKIFLHISVQRLNGNILRKLTRQYGLDAARFIWAENPDSGTIALPLRNRAGRTIGYLTWQPFTPGSIVAARMEPALVMAALLIAAIVTLLLFRVRHSTLELHASRARAQRLAYHDALTGLPNRAQFDSRLDRELESVRNSKCSVALLYLDIDRFKHINDTFGHPAGDALIRELGNRLSRGVRSGDIVARLGGDEFAIIQCGVATVSDTELLCKRVIDMVSQPFDLLGNQVHTGISIGVAHAPADGIDRNELTRKADIALYHAKAQGRGRFILFNEKMDASIRIREAIERDLREALNSNGQLQVHYQPIYVASTRKITGVEALVRWNHPVNGMMLPDAFIPIAEETGLIERLGVWVLEQACKNARLWPVETIAVNVSTAQLRNPTFARKVLEILEKTGLEPQRLELEISENCFIEHAALCEPNIVAFRANGIRLALDDFGTGYSSLNHLRQFDVDNVKIDRSFVKTIDPSSGGSPIIQAIVDLARATGLKITAEGVETEAQRRFLSSIGCHELQGYLLSRPLPASGVATLMATERKADDSSFVHENA